MEPHLPEGTLSGIRRRDPDAFAACYTAFADALYRYLRHRCDDPELAADLVESTFVELVEEAPSLVGGDGAVRAWLFRAGRNNLLDEMRKRRRRGDVALDTATAEARPTPEPGPEQQVIAADHAAVIRAALDTLSADQREVLLLRFMADLSGPEVAAITGRKVGAIKALQHRGIRALERILRERGQLEALRATLGTARNLDRPSRAEPTEHPDEST